MEALSVHLMVDLHGCPFDLLNDVEALRESLLRAAEIAETSVLGEAFHKFEPQGVSGLLLVSESHLAVHTWPEHGHAAADVFTCGNKQAAQRAAQFLVDAFQAQQHTISRVDRGVLGAEPDIVPVRYRPQRTRTEVASAAT